VEYQKIRPLFRAMFADAKMKTTYVLPGEPDKVVGFKREGANSVSMVLDGNRVLAAIDKVMSMDIKEARKLYRSGGEEALRKEFSDLLELGDATATISKPGKAQYDYEKEVKAAHAAYPQLRKKLRLSAEIKLPGEPGFGEPKK